MMLLINYGGKCTQGKKERVLVDSVTHKTIRPIETLEEKGKRRLSGISFDNTWCMFDTAEERDAIWNALIKQSKFYDDFAEIIYDPKTKTATIQTGHANDK